jgi:hypothetical protein
MHHVLLGVKRRMLPIPWALFQFAVRRTASKTARALGNLDDDQQRVHHFVVRELPRAGKPLTPESIVQGVGLPLDRVSAILDELERRLIFLFRAGGREVVWAYPVTVAPTPYPVTFSTGERLNAA